MVTSLPLVISVIIYSGRQADILACLDSLHRSSYPNNKTMVLDYILSDGISNLIHGIYPDIQIVDLYENLGYAGNNNIGIQLAMDQGADWIFILNDDTVLDAMCLTSLIDVIRHDSDIGIVGPMVYHFDEPNLIQSAGGILGNYWVGLHLGQNENDNGQFPVTHPVDWISGCAILVRREVIERVGVLDSNYFLYWEETDWCIRMTRAGWKVVHVPSAKIWHKGVQRNYKPRPSITYYTTRNHLFTLAKHRAPFGVKVFTWFQIIRTLVSWSLRPKWRNMSEHRNAMWRGASDFLRGRLGPMSV